MFKPSHTEKTSQWAIQKYKVSESVLVRKPPGAGFLAPQFQCVTPYSTTPNNKR